MIDILKVGERVIWFDSRLRQHRTGTIEICATHGYSAYIKPDKGNRHWVPKRKLRRHSEIVTTDGQP